MNYEPNTQIKDFYNPEMKNKVKADWLSMKQIDFMQKYDVSRSTAIAYMGEREYINNRYVDPDKKEQQLRLQSKYIINHMKVLDENYNKVLSKFNTTKKEIDEALRNYTFTEILNGTCINWKLKPKENLKYYTK